MSEKTSPCVGVCEIDDLSGTCTGCLRTIDEVVAWGGMSDGERIAVMATLGGRRTTTGTTTITDPA